MRLKVVIYQAGGSQSHCQVSGKEAQKTGSPQVNTNALPLGRGSEDQIGHLEFRPIVFQNFK